MRGKILAKRKQLATILCLSMLLIAIPSYSYADSVPPYSPQIFAYSDTQSDFTVKTTIYNENYIQTVVSLNGQTSKCELINGIFILDGKVIETDIVNDVVNFFNSTESCPIIKASIPSTVTWGKWTTYQKEFSVYKVAAAGIVALVTSWMYSKGLLVIPTLINVAGAVVSAGYDYLKVVVKLRTGYDKPSGYGYAQQNFKYYGKMKGGSYEFITEDTLTQKRPNK